MERTGHQSLEGVHSYKHTSEAQQENLSDILNGCTSSSTATSVEDKPEMSLVLRPNTEIISSSIHGEKEDSDKATTSIVNLRANTHCSSNSLAMKVIQPPLFNFQSCSVTLSMLIHSELTETQPCILSQTVVILLMHISCFYITDLYIQCPWT